MTLPVSIAVYLTVWFVVLFAILPFGVTSLHETGEAEGGLDPGAPSKPRLVSKAIWTTVVATAVFAFINYLAVKYG